MHRHLILAITTVAPTAAGGDQRIALSVPLLLTAVTIAVVWRSTAKVWHALLFTATGVAIAASSMGGPARALINTAFGWLGSIHF
ncbi:hypothetical protein [Streptacidiphilus sp. EB129]|uniref:hypothetical protein n=1 Tax=Streptacidiphilus sp. EB129 TaxID=3156262 RepID=UPI003519B8D3